VLLSVVEVSLSLNTFGLNYCDVVQLRCFLSIVGRTEVDLHLVNVDDGLPLVAIDGHSSILASSELLMKLAVCKLVGLLYQDLIHFIRGVFHLLNGHLSNYFLFLCKKLLDFEVKILILFIIRIAFNIFHPSLYPIEHFKEQELSVVLEFCKISILKFGMFVGNWKI